MPKVKSTKSGILQFDPNTGNAWFKEGDVIDTPLTTFVRNRLGRTLEIIEVDPVPIEDINLKKEIPIAQEETKKILNDTIEKIKTKKPKTEKKKGTGRKRK